MSARQGLGRGARLKAAVALGLSSALTGLALTGAPAPAQAAVSAVNGQWLWEGTQLSVANVGKDIDLHNIPAGTTGKGVGIALIDTGVAPVPALRSGNVVNGPDLSFDSQDPARRYVDGHGHGTHLAGIISARATGLTGLAPDAKLTSIKVGSSSGAVDVTQVIAAIDWVVAHRNDDTKNPIKVLCLAYGTDSVQNYQADPLSFAVQNAWKAGITVVVAGGNNGVSSGLVNPARNPYVIAVGAMDGNATTDWGDDKIADFSSAGTAQRHLDVIAPGRSVVSLRAPGSLIDSKHPQARVGTDYFVGSGSSQAAAVTAASAALLYQLRPRETPDKMKFNLAWGGGKMYTPVPFGVDAVNLYHAWQYPTKYPYTNVPTYSYAIQKHPLATGTGTFEGARGSIHVSDNGVDLTGEKDIFGPLSTRDWARVSAAGTAWKDGNWMGRTWTGTGWVKAGSGISSWTGRAWSGRAWSGRAWSAGSWSSIIWLSSGWS
jgi:serine protease AprX